MLSLSVLVAARNPAPGLTLQDALATLIFVGALFGEGVADRQLAAFKRDPANKGKVCDVGLWAWSRHPNYFFEWLGWCAWPVFAISLGGGWPWGWLALTGPAYMYWLLTQVSGVPLLEAHMKRSRPRRLRRLRREDAQRLLSSPATPLRLGRGADVRLPALLGDFDLAMALGVAGALALVARVVTARTADALHVVCGGATSLVHRQTAAAAKGVRPLAQAVTDRDALVENETLSAP